MSHQGVVIRHSGTLDRQLAGVQQQTTCLIYVLEGGETKQEEIVAQRSAEFTKRQGISLGEPSAAQIIQFQPPQGYAATDSEEWKKWKSRVTPGIENFTWTLPTAPPNPTHIDHPTTKPIVQQIRKLSSIPSMPVPSNSDAKVSNRALGSESEPDLEPWTMNCSCGLFGDGETLSSSGDIRPRELVVQCRKCTDWSHGRCAEDKSYRHKNNHNWQCNKCRAGTSVLPKDKDADDMGESSDPAAANEDMADALDAKLTSEGKFEVAEKLLKEAQNHDARKFTLHSTNIHRLTSRTSDPIRLHILWQKDHRHQQ